MGSINSNFSFKALCCSLLKSHCCQMSWSLALSPGSQEWCIIQPFCREELQWLLQAVLHSTSPQSPLHLAALPWALLAADDCRALSAQQAASFLPVLPELVSLTRSLSFPKRQWKAWGNVVLSTCLLSELLCARVLRLELFGMGIVPCAVGSCCLLLLGPTQTHKVFMPSWGEDLSDLYM